jgi:predicted PolB exonuclease-like 3'-5' exonuclease
MPASLDIVCQHLWIVTPKNWIDGSQVQAFFNEWRGEEIKRYCEEDVRATMDLYCKFKELNFI